MNEENQRQSSEATVVSAAKTGKAVSNIAKGAATGGVHGAAAAAVGSSKKWVVPLIGILLLPVIIVAMLPTVIFGALLGDGTDTPNGISSNDVLMQNITDMNTGISEVLSNGLNDVLDRINADFASSGCDDMEVENPYGSDVVFNANAFISQYCAYMNADAKSISAENMIDLLMSHKDKLYAYTFKDETRTVEVDDGDSSETDSSEEPATTTIKVRVYTIAYNGEAYFADQVFALTDEQKNLARQYAQNLTVLLGDGAYQVLSDRDYILESVNYDGVVFSDGSTQVVYYNQLDERWKNEPYGTDHIGGYGCGPTAMSIVVSSLTTDSVDPPHMAQWAYENGYWCSGSGSYRSLIPGAAKAWGLSVEGCTSSEPQRIVDALADGKLVVVIMGKGHFTSSGHFIVLRGCTADGKILVADPASHSRSEKAWDLTIILKEASKVSGSGGPFWIIGN